MNLSNNFRIFSVQMTEFDYQWKNLPSDEIEYNDLRIQEFLSFTNVNPEICIQGKDCLDVGCGIGRYTYAMQKLGANKVYSLDISSEAINKCRKINPNAFIFNIMNLLPNPIYDFVLSWGVLHHLQDPRRAFSKVASQVKKENGILHVMLYHKDTQKMYEEGRKIWPELSLDQRLAYCNKKAQSNGGTIHGWFDACNPSYNWGFTEKEIKNWFKEEGFSNITLVTKHNINMNGQYRN